MRTRILLAVLAGFLASVALPSAYAGGCGTLPSSASSLTLYCIPANIVNSQGSATPSGFQQMLTFNALNYSSYLSGNLENIYVYNSLSGAQMPAWIEGNALNEQQTTSLNTAANVVVWVNLGANTIPASGFANQYAIGIGSTSTDFFVSGNGIGEAPQLSSTYAEYDNGASVFSYYCNFAGTTLGCGLTVVGTPTYSVNNGLTETSVSNSNFIAYETAFSATTYATDMLGYQTDTVSNERFFSVLTGYTGTSSGMYFTGQESGTEITFYGGTGTSAGFAGTTQGSSTPAVWSLWHTASDAVGMYNYAQLLSADTTSLTSAYYQLGGTNSATNFYQWLRRRLIPPSGVMPSVSFGAAAAAAVLGITISPSTVTYGSASTATATVTPNTDGANVIYCAGNGCSDYSLLASGVGSASFTTNTMWAAGNYLFEGCDTTLDKCTAAKTLQITPGTPLITLPNFPANYVYTGTGGSITANIVTLFNQVTANAFVGTSLATSTATQASFATSASAGTYVITANSLATGNYLASSNSLTLQISQAPASLSCVGFGGSVIDGDTYNSFTVNALVTCSASSYNSQITGSLTYNSVNEGSGVSVAYNAIWNNLLNTWVWSTAGNTNYTSNSMTFYSDDLLYRLISASGNSGSQYETSTQSFTYNAQLSSAFATANVALNLNGANVMWDNATITGSPQLFTFSYPIPLLPSNALPYVFNALIYVPGAEVGPEVANTLRQTELYNYFVSGGWKYASIVDGGQQTLFSNITQVTSLSEANVSEVRATVGNQTLAPKLLSQYHYYSSIASFVANSFGLAGPELGSPATIPLNGITVNLTFGASRATRSLASTPTFTEALESLVPCNSVNTDVAFNYTFWNASQPSQQYTGNVQLSGFYQVVNGKYTSPAINGTAAGLTTTATADNYQTCETPANTVFPVSGGFSYSTPNSLISNYYLVQQSSQPRNNIHLYMSSSLTSIAQYNIGVENVSTLTFIPALVQVAQYIPNTNSSVVINEFETSAGSGYVVNLQENNIYRMLAYTLGGQYLATTPYFQAACTSGQVCSKTIFVGNSTSFLLSQIVGNLNYGCLPYIYNATPNTTEVNCNFQSVNGTSQHLTLDLWQNASAGGNAQLFCMRTVTSASGSLACTGTFTNTTSYFWRLFLNTTYGSYQLTQGSFGQQAATFADIGWLILLIGIIACGCLFVFVNPALGVLGVVVVMALEGVLGLYVETSLALGALVAFGAITAYTAYKKQQQ